MSLTIVLNGEAYCVEAETTIEQVLTEKGLQGKRLAVEVNEAIVPRSRHGDFVFTDGDKVEIVHAIGGG